MGEFGFFDRGMAMTPQFTSSPTVFGHPLFLLDLLHCTAAWGCLQPLIVVEIDLYFHTPLPHGLNFRRPNWCVFLLWTSLRIFE
jgi:hypothetical protein